MNRSVCFRPPRGDLCFVPVQTDLPLVTIYFNRKRLQCQNCGFIGVRKYQSDFIQPQFSPRKSLFFLYSAAPAPSLYNTYARVGYVCQWIYLKYRVHDHYRPMVFYRHNVKYKRLLFRRSLILHICEYCRQVNYIHLVGKVLFESVIADRIVLKDFDLREHDRDEHY